MFRLKGDLIRQLERFYNFKFHNSSKSYLKEAILSFINFKTRELNLLNISDLLIYLKNNQLFILENFEIIAIKKDYLIENKNELLTFFNPEWYSIDIINKEKYTIKERNELFNKYKSFIIEEEFNKLQNTFNYKEIDDFFKNIIDDNYLDSRKIFEEILFLREKECFNNISLSFEELEKRKHIFKKYVKEYISLMRIDLKDKYRFALHLPLLLDNKNQIKTHEVLSDLFFLNKNISIDNGVNISFLYDDKKLLIRDIDNLDVISFDVNKAISTNMKYLVYDNIYYFFKLLFFERIINRFES